MITEQDLQAAIAECQGERNPNASTCIKLAAFLTIKEYMYPEKTQLTERSVNQESSYSYASEPENSIFYEGGTEFSQAINGKKMSEVWPVIDELMTVIQAINPRLYNGVMRKLNA